MLLELEKTIVSVVEKVVPSVVSVSTTRLARIDLSRVVPLQGQGSGVILADDGHVVTNFHVVRGARHVDVTLNDGHSLHAKVVGGSTIRDLAVLKIDVATDLTPIKLGDSKSLKVGQFAIAVGNPLALGTTVTFGMVSAIDRTIKSREAFLEGLIQTTAQINPGNSGGALVDTEANLIGIPTAMIPWSQGIGFAIAIDSVKSVFDELVETGTIRTPWMGVVGVTLNRGIAAHYRLPVDKGALIVQVPRGPALRAGLKPGDVIVAVDGKKVTTMEALRSRIMRKKVGANINLKFNRGQKVLEVDLKLQEAPS
ncbi:MAG: S1C family serine protease [Candidatus Heimdallarchaeota archaeon]